MTPLVVFDTVTLLQGGGKPGGPAGRCLRLVSEDRVLLHLSAEGFAELQDVLSRDSVRRRFPLLTDEHIQTFLQDIRAKAHVMADIPAVFKYPRDPDDEHILNLTIAAKAQFLVTRDKDLLDLMKEEDPDGASFRRHCPGLQILDPGAFLAVVDPKPQAQA